MSNEAKVSKPNAAAAAPVAAPANVPVPKTAKKETIITSVTMSDGRVVGFAGRKKMLKTISEDGLRVRIDFVNGETRTYNVSDQMKNRLAGHGASQKIGDSAASAESVDDMVIAVDDTIANLNAGVWSTVRAAGDSFSGASVVIKAICEVTGKTVDWVKEFLNKKLETAVAKGESLSRKELYDSFRRANTPTGPIIARLEAEAAEKKDSKVSGASLVSEMMGA